MALRANYFFGETLSNLRRNLLMTVAAISIVLISLMLLGFAMVFGQVVSQITGGFERQVEVEVFLRNVITPEQNKDLQTLVSAMPEVKGVEYVSKEQAFKDYKEIYKESPAVYENVDPDALPASYRIALRDARTAESVASRLSGRPGVDEVRFGGESVKRLLKFNGLVRAGSLVSTAIFLVAATVLIANTIRLAIYARRREIAIMRLVGASNWFIRVPFIFEGVLEGGMGALLAAGFIVMTKMGLSSAQPDLVFLPIAIGWDVVIRVFGWLLVVGMTVGALGSAVALRRFLEV